MFRALYILLVFCSGASFGLTLWSARLSKWIAWYGTLEDWGGNRRVAEDYFLKSVDVQTEASNLMIGAIVFDGFATVLFFVLFYKAWKIIKLIPGRKSIGPGWAVVRCFIPLIHIYGLFAGLGALARQLNSAASERALKVKGVSYALAISTAFLLVLCLAPFAGVLAVPSASIIAATDAHNADLENRLLLGVGIALPGAACMLLFMNSVRRVASALAHNPAVRPESNTL